MAARPGTRATLPSTATGLGQHFTSPSKAKDKRKSQTYVPIPGHEVKRQRLLGRLDDLLNHKTKNPQKIPPADLQGPSSSKLAPNEDKLPQATVDNAEYNAPADEDFSELNALAPAVNTATRLFQSWKTVIPTLIDPFL
ncbi:hypothetical protein HYDPIDRAFT_170842 [Hydnomerulius pinastri MD-312]|uniref:Ribosome biogenesis protein SLX9 n=1 Tax=Hydnomerulius pinastri MD-312 TaxID=994086 RepID=A0A0C9W938_9AGAM|nr:hypothetical protein HYDPIDRAFT_170842 [Hydnomerulius pinastri MD-312]